MKATANTNTILTPTQNRLFNDLVADGIQPEIKAKNEDIKNHDNGEIYIAFQGRKVLAQKGREWLLTESCRAIRKFIAENN